MAVAGMYWKQQRDEDKNGNVSQERVNECNTWLESVLYVLFVCMRVHERESITCDLWVAGWESRVTRSEHGCLDRGS